MPPNSATIDARVRRRRLGAFARGTVAKVQYRLPRYLRHQKLSAVGYNGSSSSWSTIQRTNQRDVTQSEGRSGNLIHQSVF